MRIGANRSRKMKKDRILGLLECWRKFIRKDVPEWNHTNWTSLDEQAYKEIVAILSRPKVSEEFIEKQVKGVEQLYINCDSLFSRFLLNMPQQLRRILKEAGYQVGAKPTEEWIEKKARKICKAIEEHGVYMGLPFWKDFIRSLIEEIQEKKAI